MEQAHLTFKTSLPPAIAWRALCFGLLVGFIIGYSLGLPLLIVLVSLVIVLVIFYLKISPQLITLFVIGCLVALWRGNGLMPAPSADYFLGEQTFIGQVTELPRLSERITRYVVAPTDNNQLDRVLITVPTWPEFNYGDQLQIKCELKEVIFKPYTNRGIWRECSFPEIFLIKKSEAGIRHWLYQARKFAGDKVRTLVAEPYATLATGMLWGDDSGLPAGLTENFRRTGVSHLLAVSGFNVMVLVQVLFWVLLSLGLWKQQASVLVLVLTALFVIFSGAEPSVVRAGAMGSVLLLGQLLSRKPDNINVLSGTAAVMLLITPNLIAELGWQLSFAAMVGLTYISPLLRTKLTALPEFLSIRQSGAETLAATLVTTPIILVRLGTISVITPLANLLVAPVVVLVYWFGLGLLLISPLGNLFTTPASWLLTAVLFYMTTIIDWLAGLPWATIQASWLSWLGVIVFYLLVGWWLVGSGKILRAKSKNL